jgi:transketolase
MLSQITSTPVDSNAQKMMANAVRVLSMDAVQRANSGHPGLPMGMADVATVLFSQFLKFDPTNPDWPDRDRFILSAGHGSMLLYSLLHLTGYADITIDELKNFRQLGAKTAGHPEYGYAPGIEMTTGPLGQGVATSVGMALAEKMLSARFGDDLVDHYTYVLVGDGCLMEGISHEAIDLAGHLRLEKLIVLFDDNGISIDGPTSISTSMDQIARFKSANWHVAEVDGHDQQAISEAIEEARLSALPSLIACKTIIGYGSPNKEGTSATHGAPLGVDEIIQTRQQLGWESEPFDIPQTILDNWRQASSRSQPIRQQWGNYLETLTTTDRDLFEKMLAGELPEGFDDSIKQILESFNTDKPMLATRQSSELVLDRLMKDIPWLLSGSADLSGSNGTRPGSAVSILPDNMTGNYIHYGVREHAMAAAMNGLALHGGFIPLSGTFLAFADYSRPAIRMAALMNQRVIHVMTHDSIGLGEDGPTHQPVEHIASLRAMPNVLVFRPADAIEVAESWACALKQTNSPSVLCLTRQALPTIQARSTNDNLTAKGAYIVRKALGKRKFTLLATGSEVAIALEAAELLANIAIQATVVSMPCWELFEQQSKEYQQSVLGTGIRVAVEAACDMGWHRWIGDKGVFVGMSGFGASGPANELYEHFGITALAIRNKVRELVNC